ncbi:MAG: YfiR family protein [Myxococcales bacterium]|nr:YfiR family protein [Myxococcales bacterium]
MKREEARRGSYRIRMGLVLLACSMVCSLSLAEGSRYSPDDVTAAMLVKLASFIRWPPDHGFAQQPEPLRITVIDDAPLASALRRLFHAGGTGGRKVEVHAQRTTDNLAPAHIFFVGDGQAHALNYIVEVANSLHALTVARTPGFARRGIGVNFYQERDRIRFEVNVRAIEKSGLRASYKLVSLARVVQGGGAR